MLKMDAYTVNLTRHEIVIHPRCTLLTPFVQFTLTLGWAWATDAITTWDPIETGNFVLRLTDTDDDTFLPEFNDYAHIYYKESDAFRTHLNVFLSHEDRSRLYDE